MDDEVKLLFTVKQIMYVVTPILTVLIAIVAFIVREWYKGLHAKITKRDNIMEDMALGVKDVKNSVEAHKTSITNDIISFKKELITQQERISTSIHLHRDELQKTRGAVESNDRGLRQAVNDMKIVEQALHDNNNQMTVFNKGMQDLPPQVEENARRVNIALKMIKMHDDKVKTINKILSDNKLLILTKKKD